MQLLPITPLPYACPATAAEAFANSAAAWANFATAIQNFEAGLRECKNGVILPTIHALHLHE
jgi:hypothetical protein